MQKIILFFITVVLVASYSTQLVFAKKLDATVSFILDETATKADAKKIVKEFGKNFSVVQSFDLTKKTNFYIHYFATDDNFVQFGIKRGDNEDILGDARAATGGETDALGSEGYGAFNRDQKFRTQFSSGARELKSTKIEKPFKGIMVLYNSYGTELIRVESKDHYKTKPGALKNTITQMRRTIDKQKEKMAIPQKQRCLFCDYRSLKDRQREKLSHIAFIAHRNLIEQLYGEITENELPKGLIPYANLYLSMENYKTLEQLIDIDAILFDNQSGARRLPGHLINELIKTEAPKQLLEKVAAVYLKNNFQELDINNHTPLWSAIAQRNTILISKLISLNADVNQISKVDNNYLTPLILSAQLGNFETSKLLLKNGAKKSLTTTNGQTAWSTAMWMAKYKHAELLWPSEIIDPNSNEAENLLIQAAYFGQKDIVEELLAKGISISARGMNGDNIVTSSIKGIKTFTIEQTSPSQGATEHKTDEVTYWGIITAAEKAGLTDPINSSLDSKKQSLLFHAYPNGSQTVTDQHIALFSRLIKKGIDLKAVNFNGQNAEQVYQEARFAYLDTLYKSRLTKINQQRRSAAKLAQDKQNEAMQVALDEILQSKSSRSGSRSRSQAKRLEALDRADARSREIGMSSQSTRFERDTSDVDQSINSNKAKNAITQEIRDSYADELKDVNDHAKQETEKLTALIESLKQDEIENAMKRQEQISQIVSEL